LHDWHRIDWWSVGQVVVTVDPVPPDFRNLPDGTRDVAVVVTLLRGVGRGVDGRSLGFFVVCTRLGM